MRNSQTKTESIVIKRTNFKDQDKIVTLYTKDLGKIGVMARGIRKLESKRKSHFELGNHIKTALIESHKFYIVTQTEIINTHAPLKTNLTKVNTLYYLLEIFDGLVPEKDENTMLFKFLNRSLDILETLGDKSVDNFLNAYTTKLLRMSGFLNDPLEIIHTKSNKAFYNYLENLINKTYDEIMLLEPEDHLYGQIFLLLKTYTENILEKRIKSL